MKIASMGMKDITEKVKRNVSSVSFRKAKHDKNGSLVLKRRKTVRFSLVVIFIIIMVVFICVLLLGMKAHQLHNNDVFEFLAAMLFLDFFIGIISLIFLVSKTVVKADGITAYRIYGKKHIKFDSITSVEFTDLYGCCLILKGEDIKLLVPLQTYGFIEFYEILKSKVKSSNLQKCLFEKNMELPQYYDNVEEKRNGFTVTRQGSKRIIGIENMSYQELLREINRGKRFVTFNFSIFVLFLSVRGTSPIYFGEKSNRTLLARIGYTLLSMLILIITIMFLASCDLSFLTLSSSDTSEVIATIFLGILLVACIIAPMGAIITNLKGGNDVTDTMINYINTKLE